MFKCPFLFPNNKALCNLCPHSSNSMITHSVPSCLIKRQSDKATKATYRLTIIATFRLLSSLPVLKLSKAGVIDPARRFVILISHSIFTNDFIPRPANQA